MTEAYRAPRTSEQEIVFDGAPVIVLKKPKLWPGGEGSKTEVQAVWSPRGLHVGYKIYGKFADATGDPSNKMSVNRDDKVEVFILPTKSSTYFSFEMNRALQVLDFSKDWGETIDFSWNSHARGTFLNKDGLPFIIITVPWTDLGYEKLPPNKGIKVGFYRGETFVNAKGELDYIWTSWIDPESREINFHRPETFASLELL